MKILIGIFVIILFISLTYMFTELIFPYRKEIKNLKVNDKCIYRNWGNSIVQIIAINEDRTRIKFKVIEENGKKCLIELVYSLRIDNFFDNYIKLQE